jgi:hypothetical protein
LKTYLIREKNQTHPVLLTVLRSNPGAAIFVAFLKTVVTFIAKFDHIHDFKTNYTKNEAPRESLTAMARQPI